MNQDDKYLARGVSSQKDEVHKVIKDLDKGLYPRAFAKILPDVVAPGDETWCNLMHADTAGTKTAIAYLYWKETGDPNLWKGIAQDAIIMNVDDMICVGCFEPIVLSSTIGRNKHLIPQEVIGAVIQGAEEVMDRLRDMGCDIYSSGGETADVGDIVRTIDVGYTAFARMKRSDVLQNDIQSGQQIVALASDGQAVYESEYNSGIGSNGLTSARHDVLNQHYARHYPETYSPETQSDFVFSGQYRLTDDVTIDDTTYRVGSLLLSPTRTYYPVLRKIMEGYRTHIHGVIHCTGGAQTKVLKFAPGVAIDKTDLFSPPPVFQLIHKSSGSTWEEMYQVFNMGHRLELYVDDSVVEPLIALSQDFGIQARRIGEVLEEKEDYRLKINAPDGSVVKY